MTKEPCLAVSARPPTSTPRYCNPTGLRAVATDDPKTKAVDSRTFGGGGVLGGLLAGGRIQLGPQGASREAQ
jgi:hypothetical protein